jgi:hypothetical protein
VVVKCSSEKIDTIMAMPRAGYTRVLLSTSDAQGSKIYVTKMSQTASCGFVLDILSLKQGSRPLQRHNLGFKPKFCFRLTLRCDGADRISEDSFLKANTFDLCLGASAKQDARIIILSKKGQLSEQPVNEIREVQPPLSSGLLKII